MNWFPTSVKRNAQASAVETWQRSAGQRYVAAAQKSAWKVGDKTRIFAERKFPASARRTAASVVHAAPPVTEAKQRAL